MQLHVEWRDPKLPPDKVNQDRGNSGILLQDVYEVQILDNFENPTYVNGRVGSIYKQFPPLVNATWPAETWNTYDIIYTAPRFATDGSLTSPARLTVLLNGVLVQNNSSLKGGTTYIGAPSYRPYGDQRRCGCRITDIWCGIAISGCEDSSGRESVRARSARPPRYRRR